LRTGVPRRWRTRDGIHAEEKRRIIPLSCTTVELLEVDKIELEVEEVKEHGFGGGRSFQRQLVA
jgi:hypothetical protein